MSPAAVVWIAFAGNGNVRFWTADEGRAKDEKAHGMDLRAFTLPELVALISASRSPSETEIVRQAQMAAVKEFAASLVTYLDPIDDTIDKQTYSAKIAADFDLPDDAEHEITLTAKLERSFCAAVNKIDLAARNPERLLQFDGAAPRPSPSATEPLRYCDYCKSWNSKPCGEQCVWTPDMPTVPERETFWLLERHDGKAWARYTSHSGIFVYSHTKDVWQAGRFQSERHAHDVWRSLDKAERERWKPVEHMFINKVLRPDDAEITSPAATADATHLD